MTLFDYIVLGVLALSAVLGFWRGMVGELLSLAAWVLAFLGAKMFAGEVAILLVGQIGDATVRYATAFALVFIAVLIVTALIRVMLQGLLRAIGLGLLDRLLGVIFGAIRGLIVVLLGVALAGMTSLPHKDWWQEASFSAPLETFVIAGKPWLPAEIAKRIRFR